jgi:hypothetical protein
LTPRRGIRAFSDDEKQEEIGGVREIRGKFVRLMLIITSKERGNTVEAFPHGSVHPGGGESW